MGGERQDKDGKKTRGQKPHLLVSIKNNLGAETKVQYAPSTKFYLEDKEKGQPWVTRIPFPVHVVERVETYDYISRNYFVTRYAYHHGYYDGIEREFRGFGRVDQWDTEDFDVLSADGTPPPGINIEKSSHVPPVLTRTWFHTGAFPQEGRISRHFEDEYYHEGDPCKGEAGLTDEQLEKMLLPDTVLPATIRLPNGQRRTFRPTPQEIEEACRALKGSILRQEIYALDDTDAADRPYSASERNYTIECLQPQGPNRHAVFFTHARETIDFHYERKLYDISGEKRPDPRVSHAMTLAVDVFGNDLQSVAIGYGRRYDDPDPLLTAEDRDKQKQVLITYTENEYAKAIKDEPNDYRTPLPCETRTYELRNLSPKTSEPLITNLFRFSDFFDDHGAVNLGQLTEIPYENLEGISSPSRRLIEHERTLYRGMISPASCRWENSSRWRFPGEHLQARLHTRSRHQGLRGGRVTDRHAVNRRWPRPQR